MADIQQWRRMIQTTRTRTPAVDLEDTDNPLPPNTPRKGLKPKFSSYFTQNANGGPSKKESLSSPHDAVDVDWPSWPADDPYPSPDADVLIDSVMCRILRSPYQGLDPRFNSILLSIFEGFRSLSDEKQRLLLKVEQDADRLSEMERMMQKSAQRWSQEKREYKAEIKRLEVLLANGSKRGLAEVTLARQDSLLSARNTSRNHKARKHDTLETIFQFMEKNKRVEEKVWGFQRATMRRKSPSADMRRLSKTFLSQSGSYPNLPPGTLTDGPSTLAEASFLEECASGDGMRLPSNPKTSLSEDDTISTFSCAGDLLPDESGYAVHNAEATETDHDVAAIKRIAHILAKRRNVNVDVVMPKLLEMFAAQPGTAQTANLPPTRKNTKLMAKASGFFHKLKPQLNLDTSCGEGRRFSFEAGDDSSVSAPGLNTTRAASSSVLTASAIKERALRKSASTPLLLDHARQQQYTNEDRSLSPVQHSPTSSTPVSESRRLSKIPTPVHSSTLARPRQERESSESSLLTAIRYCEDTDRRSSSLSSSGYSSPSAGRMELTAGSQGTASNRLLDHTKALRGNALVGGAVPKLAETSNVEPDPSSSTLHEKRLTAQKMGMNERRKENAYPMSKPDHTADREDLRHGDA